MCDAEKSVGRSPVRPIPSSTLTATFLFVDAPRSAFWLRHALSRDIVDREIKSLLGRG
jgi:hypothetical protein